jgi:Protein phosphatase inhibitor
MSQARVGRSGGGDRRSDGRKMWWIMRGWGGRVVKVRFCFLGVKSRSGLEVFALTICTSLVCCIYHRPRAVGESSSEDDSSSSSDDSSSDDGGDSSGADDGAARPVGGGRGWGKKRRRHHHHEHGHGDNHGKDGDGAGEGSGRGKRRPSPNAYEKMPKTNMGPKGSKDGTSG